MAFKQGYLLTLLSGTDAVPQVVEYSENESVNSQAEATSSTGGEMQEARGPRSSEITIRIASDAIPTGFDVGSVVALSSTTDGSAAGFAPDSYLIKTRGQTVATKGIIYQTFTAGLAQD